MRARHINITAYHKHSWYPDPPRRSAGLTPRPTVMVAPSPATREPPKKRHEPGCSWRSSEATPDRRGEAMPCLRLPPP